jgi:hypothetical protein
MRVMIDPHVVGAEARLPALFSGKSATSVSAADLMRTRYRQFKCSRSRTEDRAEEAARSLALADSLPSSLISALFSLHCPGFWRVQFHRYDENFLEIGLNVLTHRNIVLMLSPFALCRRRLFAFYQKKKTRKNSRAHAVSPLATYSSP